MEEVVAKKNGDTTRSRSGSRSRRDTYKKPKR